MAKSIFSLVEKAIFDFDLIQSGDKILLGASGGKDSTFLAEYFSRRILRKNIQGNFSFRAIYVKSDFSEDFPKEILSLFCDWKIDFEILPVKILSRLKPGKKMNCFWCATQRRTELLNYALKNGFNKIALAHHLDDVLQTFLMNACEKGKLETIFANFSYKKYPVKIIRPLFYISEKSILEYAQNQNWKNLLCHCPYEKFGARKSAAKKLATLCPDEATKYRILRGIIKNEKICKPE